MSKGKKVEPAVEVVYRADEGLRDLTYMVTSQSQLGIYDDYISIFDRSDEVRVQQQASVRKRAHRKKQKIQEERAMAEEMLKKRNEDVQMNAKLQKYGLLIQKFTRGYPYRKKFKTLKASLQERTSRRAIVIGIDKYDDNRLRPTVSNVANALEVAYALQQLNFSVECYFDTLPQPERRPTRANILRALESLKSGEGDLSVVFIACHGVYAPVQGHNPFKTTAKEGGQGTAATARERLAIVLQRSLARSKNGGEDIKENVVRAIIPCDTKAARLTFESVISIEELQELVLNTGGPLIYGRRAAQKILCVDTTHAGVFEGSQGYGYSYFGSTCSKEHIWDYLRPSNQDVEQRNVFSHAFQNALQFGIQGMMSVGTIIDYLKAVMDKYNIPLTMKGKAWGDITLMSPERVTQFEANLTLSAVYTRFRSNVQEMVASDDEIVITNKLMNTKVCCFRVFFVVDALKTRSDVDFTTNDFVQEMVFKTQQHLSGTGRLQLGCVEPSWTIQIGLSGTFIDVAKAKKVDGNIWDVLLQDLFADYSYVSRSYQVYLGKAMEGGLLLSISTNDPQDVITCKERLSRIPNTLGFGAKTMAVQIPVVLFGTAHQYDFLSLYGCTQFHVRPVKKAEDRLPDMPAIRSLKAVLESQQAIEEDQHINFGISDVVMLLHRVNDIDNYTVDGLSRRDKAPLAPSNTPQSGVALFLCAVTGTNEQKAKQIAEICKVQHIYNPFRGITYMYWEDVPPDPTKERKFMKHLAAVRPSINFPGLVLIDTVKKRNYMLKLAQEKSFFPMNYVVAFSEEYLKGALNELLPPVRGSKAYGCGSTNTKFVLIQT